MKQALFGLALGLGLVLSACQPTGKTDTASDGMSSAQPVSAVLPAAAFETTLSKTAGAVVLDVRTPEEYNTGYLPGAVLMDFSEPEFDQKLSALDRGKPYFIYCAAGGRSHKAFDRMKELGFQAVYELEGGTMAWTDSGRPLQHPDHPVQRPE